MYRTDKRTCSSDAYPTVQGASVEYRVYLREQVISNVLDDERREPFSALIILQGRVEAGCAWGPSSPSGL